MKAIVNTGPGRLEMVERALPMPGPGQVRIRTQVCGVCATDLRMIAGWTRTPWGAIPGHEWAGTVDAVGAGVDIARVGRHCVAENVLADGGEVGFEHPGGYAQYLLTEAANLQLLPDHVPLNLAALAEPLAVAIRAVRRLDVAAAPAPSPALLLGDGPLGLLILCLLRWAGVEQVICVGGRAERLALAAELGAAATINYHETPDLTAAIQQTVGAAPLMVEASGSAAALAAGLACLGHGGRAVVAGDYDQARAAFRWNDLLHREITLAGSNASADAWPAAARLLASGKLPLARLVTHCLPAAQFEEAVALAASHRGDVVKVVMEW
jgi:2-desacetyl-2-hydroxyethyl bacteriochlorophyllide A dehydrogenase